MVVAPARPHVRSYDGENPHELIDSPFGHMERWRADAIATGELSALIELTAQVRNDAAAITAKQDAREAELNARQDAISARELQHAVNVTNFTDFVGRAATLIDRLQKMRADAEAQAEPLATPPGSPVPGSDDAPAHTPGGELHDLAAKDEPAVASEDQAEFPQGELPAPPVVQQPIADEE